ncbi:MAG: hypothetical protein ACHQ2Z_16420, partial [Elusimicrobiota bacterium]
MNRGNRRSPWISLCARLTLASFAATLPGPAAWAQAVERVAPLTGSAISGAAGASLAAPSAIVPAQFSLTPALAAAPLSAAAPALAAAPLAAPAVAVAAELSAPSAAAAAPASPAALQIPSAIGTLRMASGAAASGPSRSGGETFDASRPRSGDAAASVPASPSDTDSKGSRGSKLSADPEVAGLPAAYNTFKRLKSRMKAIGMPVDLRRIAVSDFTAISRPGIEPAESIALRAHLKKMMDESWSTRGGSFPERPKLYPIEKVVFPGQRASITVGVDSPAAKDLLAAKSGADGGYILAVTQGPEGDRPFEFATLARVISTHVEGDRLTADVQG